MAEFKKLMEPGYIKNLKIKNRVSLAPMERGLGDRYGNVTQTYIDYLEERAKNGVGMITVEATFIDPVGRGNIFQLGLSSDSNIASHKKMTETLHKYGTIVATELHHAGRNAATPKTGFQPVAPSAVTCEVAGGYLPRELTIPEIKDIIGKFAEAARRAKEAGYDMVTLHGAHGYLITAFLSPFTNKRTDDYGGTPEKRSRFGIEVLQAVRAELGDDYPIGCRISADEFVEGGLTLDDTMVFAKQLEDAGLDYLDVSAAIYESAQLNIPSMDIPIGCFLPFSAAMKEVVDIPVIATGRINDMVFADKALERNEADFVHMVRAFHADPKILVKSQKGDMEDICMCMACNKCIDLLFVGERVRCTVNPSAGREKEMELKPAKEKKKVVVLGGGIAGMEAASTAALRGHDVTLFEKAEELGGAVRMSSKGQYREEWWQAARYRIHKVNRAGVEVKLGKEATLADVKALKPDAVVVATGTVPFVPIYTPGADKPIVTDYKNVLLGRRNIGKNAVVIGGQDIGLTTAEFLSENGCNVTIIDDSGALGADLGGLKQMTVLPRVAEDSHIKTRMHSNVERIGDDWVEIQSEGKRDKITGIDMVVFAIARDMQLQLADEISEDSTAPEVYLIGDAVKPRFAIDAIYEGAAIGRRL